MSNEIKRMKYFNGLLLKEEDLALEQEYHMKLQRLHNRFFHDWGIVDGLRVESVSNYPQITVSQGFALNRITKEETNEKFSQEIWICENHPDNPVNLSEYDADEDIYITVTYEEAEADVDNKKGGDRNIHIWERSRINHGRRMPADPSREIVLARVRLKDLGGGNKSVAEITTTEADGVTQICTYAVTQGTAQEFERISIGEKDKLYLPYINGFVDKNLGNTDGLEVHSPYTKFSGSVITGGLKTNGITDLNGTFAVNVNNIAALKVDSKGEVYVAKSASVTGGITSAGGLNISGDNTILNTSNVVLTGNMLTVNKYTPGPEETEPKKISSGVEIFRGGAEPDAKFLWDESEKVWKAGTDKREGNEDTGLYRVAYGTDWDKMHGGVNVDTLHKHSVISDADNNTVLSVDSDGNVNIDKDIEVSGSVVAKGGIKVPSGNSEARLEWSESDKKWQIGLGKEMYNIPYGQDWIDLTASNNADHLHTHSEIYNSDGRLAMSASPNGDVSVSSNLLVGKDLLVEGKLTVLDTATQYIQMQQVVTENVVLVNKPEDGQTPVAEGGLEVYRGGGLPNARIIWDEGSDSWKIGTGSSMSEIPSGIEWEYLTHGQPVDELHKHSTLTDREGNTVVAVDVNGNVGAFGDISVNGNVSVENDAQVKGDIALEGSMTIKGDLTVDGTQTIINTKTIEVDDSVIMVNKYTGQSAPINNEAGLEVYRGGVAANAKVLWNEAEKKWKVGTGDSMVDLPYGDDWDTLTNLASADRLHTHGRICDAGGAPAIDINQDGNIDIAKDTKVSGELVVEGSVTVTGELHAINIDSIDKVDLHVEDNVILLNKYEGAAPPIDESGIEIYRGDEEPKARLVWDEAAGKWKVGVGDQLREIAYGNAWDQLTKLDNADDLHIHGQLYNEKGDVLAVSTRATGNVDVVHDLTVGQDLAVLGNLDVRGALTRISSKNVEIVGNSIVMNRVDTGEVPKVDSGLSVFRGTTENSAVMLWDEVRKYWKMGLAQVPAEHPDDQFFKVYTDGSIAAPSATVNGLLISQSANIEGSIIIKDGIEISQCDEGTPFLKWDNTLDQWQLGIDDVSHISATVDGNVGIGNTDPKEKLDVVGNVAVSGNVYTNGNTVIQGQLTSGSTEIKGSLKVNGGISLFNGLEVDRGVDSKGNPLAAAKIVWDESKGTWKFGIGDNLGELILSGQHKHYRLYTEDGNVISVSTASNGYVGIGTVNPQAKLDVLGDALIEGKVSAMGAVEASGSGLFGGKISARDSFELIRSINQKNAKLYWDEVKDVWQAGTEDNLKDISLTGHTHSSLHTQSGNAAVNVDSSGNVAVGKEIADAKLDVNGSIAARSINITGSLTATGNLKGANAEIDGAFTAGNATIDLDMTVNRNLIVNGNLTVSGDVVSVNTTTLDVEDNIITLNKYAPQPAPADKNAGIEVYRGGTAKNAQVIWDESADEWKAGTDGALKALSYSDHTHPQLTSLAGAISVADGNIGIGAIPSEKLSVAGNAGIDGSLTAESAQISGELTAGSAQVNGSLSAQSAQIDGSLSAESAQIDGSLTAGSAQITGILSAQSAAVSGNLSAQNATLTGDLTVTGNLTASNGKTFSYSDHTHASLTSLTDIIKVAGGKIGIGTETPGEKFSVDGNADIAGSLKAESVQINGSLSAESLQINDSLSAQSAAISQDLTVAGDLAVGGNLQVSTGLETSGTEKGKIAWNSTDKKWQAGTETGMKDIEYVGHTHTKLFSTKATEAVTVNDDGNVGIGADPEADIRLNVGGVVQATNIVQTSSMVYKENIEELPIKTALDLLKKLNPVTFDYKSNFVKKHNIGFIAEDVPEIFTTPDCKSISIMDIVAVLTSVVKKQQTEAVSMKKQLKDLQKQVADLAGKL